MDFSKLTI